MKPQLKIYKENDLNHVFYLVDNNVRICLMAITFLKGEDY